MIKNIELKEINLDQGGNLYDLSFDFPILLVFLRSFGCAFCKEAMDDLSKKKIYYSRKGIKLVLVYLAEPKEGKKYFEKFNLDDQLSISDPQAAYYKMFGLVKGKMNQLFGLSTLIKGSQLGLTKGFGFNWFIGDGFQMPGVFVIYKNKIENQFIHYRISDKPNYDKLLSTCEILMENEGMEI